MSRVGRIALLCLTPFGTPLAAQDGLEAQSGTPPERIDIKVDTSPEAELPAECEAKRDAAQITGEIVVCGPRRGNDNRLYDKETAQRRHAERTMHANDPQAPEMFGIPNHGPVVARGCFIGPCPKEPAILIDFDSLPDTPPGSDADRMARGLAPRGNPAGDNGAVRIAGEAGFQSNADELGLPPPPGEASQTESASPVEEPSG